MSSNFFRLKTLIILLSISFFCNQAIAQKDTNKWKLQLAFGMNSPSGNQVEGYEAKSLNFPTINLGVQYMFKPQLGAKLDLGYNRFASDSDAPEFKLNYTRVNAQVVYDLSRTINLPPQLALVSHLGPGVSITKPLRDDSDNKYTYLNVMGGLELHYAIAENISVFTDVSYIKGLSSKVKYDPVTDGYSFNGDLLTLTFGVSVSLSGCTYCD